MSAEEGGLLSGEHGGIKVLHHSVSSLVRIKTAYDEQVRQGEWEKVTHEYWLDYEEIKDLFLALNKAHEGNLSWLLKKQ